MYQLFQISSDVLKTLGLKMKFMITFIFTSVLIGSVFILSSSNNFDFNDQLLYATINGTHKKTINLLNMFFLNLYLALIFSFFFLVINRFKKFQSTSG